MPFSGGILKLPSISLLIISGLSLSLFIKGQVKSCRYF